MSEHVASTRPPAIVIIDHGSKKSESNDAFIKIVRRFAARSRYEIVEPAHMELASPTIEAAFQRVADQGANEVIVLPYFLLPGRHWQEDIPRLCTVAAQKTGIKNWKLAPPLGESEKLIDLIEERIADA